jgi:hypothetical protein
LEEDDFLTHFVPANVKEVEALLSLLQDITTFSPGYLGVSTGPAEDTAAAEDTAEEDTAVADGASIAAVAE